MQLFLIFRFALSDAIKFKSGFSVFAWLCKRHKSPVQSGKSTFCPMKEHASEKNHNHNEIGGKEMLSRDCDGCSQMKACNRRFYIVEKGNCVYCPDGTAHLVDGL